MLLRGSNGVGYTNYPDNVVRFFVKTRRRGGVDLFRVFDCLNWVENMRVSIDAVNEAGKICEGAICYTGDMLDPDRSKYDLKYYVALAKELEAAGAHILGLKDMAGLLKPAAARVLVKRCARRPACRSTSTPTTPPAPPPRPSSPPSKPASMPSMRRWTRLSGTTSQPTLGSIVAGARTRRGAIPARRRRRSARSRSTGKPRALQYRAFESDLRSGASEVYLHEMPGGQFTNLKEQARSLGLESRWHEVAQTYADVNRMFGDIVKVTPSSKVVGDMALAMVSAGTDACRRRGPGPRHRLPRFGRRVLCRAISASRRAASPRRCRRRCSRAARR
jgi:pyruvate carboxylase